MIILKKNGEFKEMGEPRKETQFWLFFKNGKLPKHSLARTESALKQFRAELSFNNHQPINNTIN
jgi:hypothetical protein